MIKQLCYHLTQTVSSNHIQTLIEKLRKYQEHRNKVQKQITKNTNNIYSSADHDTTYKYQHKTVK